MTVPQLHLVFLPASSSRSPNMALQLGQVTEMGMGMLPGGVAAARYSSKGIASRGRVANEAKPHGGRFMRAGPGGSHHLGLPAAG